MPWPTYSRTTVNPASDGDVFDRGADVAEPVADDDLVDGGLEGGPGDLDEPLRFGVDLADGDGDGRVGVPALDDRAAVDGEDVALLEDHLLARDAVDDDLVR